MTANSSTESVRMGSGAMFDGIAPGYDRLNRMMSFGMDRRWRRRLVAALDGKSAVLDLATGTGDVARALLQADPRRSVVGVDPSVGMLEVGRHKLAEFGDRARLLEGVAEALPLPDNSVDAVCIAFGIRNVPDRAQGLREMRRVCRPGGVIAVLELGEPRRGLLAPLARAHVHHIVPRLGALLSGSSEYAYLQRSIAAFPTPEDFAEEMRLAGLVDVRIERMSFDAVHLYIASTTSLT